MPIINIAVSGEPDSAVAAEIACEVSKITATNLRKDPALTAVTISYIDPRHWFAGGKSLADQGKKSFWLDVKVVDGTNTKLEMEAYLDAIFAAFDRLLGNLHEESYALVHEVPAASYGYAGKTQEFRFITGRLNQAV